MILVQLKKHYASGKMFVNSWIAINKEIASNITIIPGVKEIVEGKNIPSGFYKNASQYFLEDGILRNGYGINL